MNNKKKILRMLKHNPLMDLLSKKVKSFFTDDAKLFEESYLLFFLSTNRLLNLLSIGKLYERECRRSRKFNSRQKNIAKKFNSSAIYLDLDWATFILFTRILLDRYTKFINPYFNGLREQLPSSSFRKHRDFFFRDKNFTDNVTRDYQELIKNETNWFNPLKEIRDIFIVHTYKKAGYLKFIGSKNLDHWADEIVFIIPDKEKDLSKCQVPPLSLNCYKIVDDIYVFFKKVNKIFRHTRRHPDATS